MSLWAYSPSLQSWSQSCPALSPSPSAFWSSSCRGGQFSWTNKSNYNLYLIKFRFVRFIDTQLIYQNKDHSKPEAVCYLMRLTILASSKSRSSRVVSWVIVTPSCKSTTLLLVQWVKCGTFSQNITWHPQGKQVGGGGGRQEIEKVERKGGKKDFNCISVLMGMPYCHSACSTHTRQILFYTAKELKMRLRDTLPRPPSKLSPLTWLASGPACRYSKLGLLACDSHLTWLADWHVDTQNWVR